MKRHSLLVVLCIVSTCLFAGVSLLAQDSITVTVSATGPADTPLLTLGKPLFTVQESGKARTITTFVGPETKPAAPPRLQPNEISNLPDFRETSGAVVVVLDTIHTRHIDEGDTRQEILAFMAKAAQSKHAVTLCILSDKGLHVVHDYRTGSDVLLAALAKTGLGGMKGVAPPPGVSEAEVTADAARLNSFNIGEQSEESGRRRINSCAPTLTCRSSCLKTSPSPLTACPAASYWSGSPMPCRSISTRKPCSSNRHW